MDLNDEDSKNTFDESSSYFPLLNIYNKIVPSSTKYKHIFLKDVMEPFIIKEI